MGIQGLYPCSDVREINAITGSWICVENRTGEGRVTLSPSVNFYPLTEQSSRKVCQAAQHSTAQHSTAQHSSSEQRCVEV
jgi:hypothetical protein